VLPALPYNTLKVLMPAVRIELTTYRLQGGCSTAELSRLRTVIAETADYFKKSRRGVRIG
jgi:hypothetical protein